MSYEADDEDGVLLAWLRLMAGPDSDQSGEGSEWVDLDVPADECDDEDCCDCGCRAEAMHTCGVLRHVAKAWTVRLYPDGGLQG